MLSSSAIPGIIVFFLRAGGPESSRWLVCHGQSDKAKEIVKKHLGPEVNIDNLIELSKHIQKDLEYKHLFSKNYGNVRHLVVFSTFTGSAIICIFHIRTHRIENPA